ncbi:MAG: hypothetical protein M3257_03595 [Actinomycetota bacterium]|nr:hypothetical protein [Actinomycetota bacterium]
MWIVLAHSTDASALWVFQRLHARSRHPVELLLVEALDTPVTSWVHEVSEDGANVEVHLDDRRRVSTVGIRAVLNRLTWPPMGLVAAAAPADAAYAQSELTAFAMSWLRSLAPVVVNEPTPQGLCGRWRPSLHWRALGMRAGLPVAPLRLASANLHPQDVAEASTMILMVDGELLGSSAPDAIRKAARRLAALSGTAILGLWFAGSDPARSGWRLLDATPQPDLTAAGEAGVAALEAVLAR